MKFYTLALITALALTSTVQAETMQGGSYTLNGSVDVVNNQGQGGTFTLSPNGDSLYGNGSGGTYVLYPSPYSQSSNSPTPTQEVIQSYVSYVTFGGQQYQGVNNPGTNPTNPTNPNGPDSPYIPGTTNPPRGTNQGTYVPPSRGNIDSGSENTANTDFPDMNPVPDVIPGNAGTGNPDSSYTYPNNTEPTSPLPSVGTTSTEAEAVVGSSKAVQYALYGLALLVLIALIIRWIIRKMAVSAGPIVPPGPTIPGGTV